MWVGLKHKKLIVQGIRIFFILLFTYVAVTKFKELDLFQIQLEQFPFLSASAEWLVWVVPSVQIIIAFLFLFDISRLAALVCSFLLMLILTLYIIAVLNFADFIPCSCAGVLPSLSWSEQLIFNFGCLLLALLGIAFSFHLKTYYKHNLIYKEILLQQKQEKPKT